MITVRRNRGSGSNVGGPITAGGVPIPAGWALQRLDTFGSAGSIPGPVRAHSLYNEAIYFGRDTYGRVTIPNTVINNQQQTFQHFEDATWAWSAATDHLTIQARGQGDNSIKSGQIASRLTARSFIYEVRMISPNVLGTWLSMWAYASASGGDTSELDVEMPVSEDGTTIGVHDVTLSNHPYVVPTTDDPNFSITGVGLVYRNAAFNHGTSPHYYAIYYDDTGPGTIRRYIDGILIYHGIWKWNSSLGGTGFGPDAAMVLDLGAGSGSSGGEWPGTIATPSTFSADLNVYSVGFYTPGSAGRGVPAGEAWDYNRKSANIVLSGGDLIATSGSGSSTNQIVCALDGAISGNYYWEIVVTSANAMGGTATYFTDPTTGNYLGTDLVSLGWFNNGSVFWDGFQVATWASFGTSAVRLCFAVSLTVGGTCTLWGRVGTSGLWNNVALGSSNPATNLGGYTLSSGLSLNVLPAAMLYNAGDTAVLCAASSSWVGTPPSGYGQIGPT